MINRLYLVIHVFAWPNSNDSYICFYCTCTILKVIRQYQITVGFAIVPEHFFYKTQIKCLYVETDCLKRILACMVYLYPDLNQICILELLTCLSNLFTVYILF